MPISNCKVSFWKGTIIKAKDGKGRREWKGNSIFPLRKCQPPSYTFFHLDASNEHKWANIYISLTLRIGPRWAYLIPLKEFFEALREGDIDYTCALWSNMYLIKYPRWSNICKLKPFPPKPSTPHQNLECITIMFYLRRVNDSYLFERKIGNILITSPSDEVRDKIW